MKHSKTASLLAASLVQFGSGTDINAENNAGKMNFVFILVDDLGYMDVALNGSEYYETPNIQRIAREGVTFTNAYAHPLSSPSRSAILSGQYPHRTMITMPVGHLADNANNFNVEGQAAAWQEYHVKNALTGLPVGIYTMGQAFQDNGYHTALIGKHHLGVDAKYQMGNRGFKHDMGMPVPGPESYYDPYFNGVNGIKWNAGSPLFQHGEHITDRLAREADAYITERVKASEPFLLHFWDFSIHAPFEAKKEYVAYFKAKDVPGSPQNGHFQMAAMIKVMDDAVGKIMDCLERNGIADNTVVVIVGDNGGNMYDSIFGDFPTNNYPLRQGKGTIYEGGIRVPLVVKAPGLAKPGSVVNENVHLVDFYPTFIEIADIKIDPSKFLNANHHSLTDRTQVLDGMSLVPLLNGTETALDRPGVFTNFPHNVPAPGNTSSDAINSGDWKLIINYETMKGMKERYELYHLKENITETVNVAGKYPAKVEELKGYIEAHHAAIPQAKPQINVSHNPNAEIPMAYKVWDEWLKRFTELTANDRELSQYPRVVTRSAELDYFNKIKNSLVFRLGSPCIFKHGYDGKVSCLPYKKGKNIFLPAESFGLSDEYVSVKALKKIKTVTRYDRIIIVSDRAVLLTDEEVARTNAYLDSFDRHTTVQWKATHTLSDIQKAEERIKSEGK